MAVKEINGAIECWLPPHDEAAGIDRPFTSGPHQCDFWRAAPSGRMFLIRGYQEDGLEASPSGAIFDTTLPIWRIGEAFLHAAKLAQLIAKNPAETMIRLRVVYTGLKGRGLYAWASPHSDDYFGGRRARSDEAVLEGIAPVEEVVRNLGHPVFPLITSLFERFGVSGLSPAFVDAELKRMRHRNFGEDGAQANG